MRIRLLHSYSGALTNEKRMAEGEHDVTDALGNYLVANGHAVDITPVIPQAVEPVEVVSVTSSGSWSDVTPNEPKQPRKQERRK